MAKNVRSLSKGSRLAWGLGCIAIGCYPVSIALGLFQLDETTLNAPRWVVAAAGIAFVIAGLMILLAQHSRANDFLAGILCFVFGAMGTWVSLFSSNDGFSGGLAILPHEQNIMLGRWIFGLGAVICYAISVYAFRRAAQSSR